MHLFILLMIVRIEGTKRPTGRLRTDIIKNSLGLSKEDNLKINGLFYRVKQLEDHDNTLTKDIRELRTVHKIILIRF